MERSKVKVGARLLWVERPRWTGGSPTKKWIVVTKVGRRWASFLPEGSRIEDRFDMDTFYVDGHGYSPRGRIYADEWEHEMAVEATETWAKFKAAAYRAGAVPDGMDAKDIMLIAKRLGLNLR